MKKIFVLIFTFFILFFLSHLSAPLTLAQWEPVASGIEYQQFTLPDPNKVFVTRMDRSNQSVTLESSIAQGRLASGKETVSGMAARYDQAINFWGQSWGSRNDVVVAINGSFHNTTTGVPVSGQIHSGWYTKRFDNFGGVSGFAWKMTRAAFIGECIYHRPEEQFITFTASGNTQQFDGINFDRGSNELILYTPQYDSNTGTDDSGVEVLVEMTRPTLILPQPAMAKGYVREIHQGQGSTPIPFDHIVLSATGTAATTLLDNINIGDEIGVAQELRHYESDCNTPLGLDWTKVYASVGGSFPFLKDGVIKSFPDNEGATQRNPRTAIAFNDSYIFHIVVDGRDPAKSVGMTIDELATFTRDTLGATWAIAQDGGGSSTMVVNGEVKNNPSDGSERAVANGMMMVVVEPMEQSTSYTPDDPVTTVTAADIRLGPGTNYAVLTSVPQNTDGLILDHFNNLGGVFAKGSYWWKVKLMSGAVGWVTEQSIRLDTPPAGFMVESRSGGLNYANYSDSGISDSSLKSTATGTTLGIGSREGSLKRAGGTRSATFSVTPDTTGTYEVFATWGASSNNHSIVEHIVSYDGGSTSVLMDQTIGENTWNSLGQYNLTANNTYAVRLTNQNYSVPNNSSKVFRADAVLWKLVSETPTGSIAGAVTNAEDGTAIPGATVLVENTGQSVTTDSNGNYSFTDVLTGDNTLTASAIGFARSSQTVTVIENLITTADFALTPQPEPTIVSATSITYATEGGKNGDKHLVITVVLEDDMGQSVADASVSIDLFRDANLDSSYSGTTGTDGTVTFSRKNAPSACYTSTAIDVAATGLIWDGITPANQFCK